VKFVLCYTKGGGESTEVWSAIWN